MSKSTPNLPPSSRQQDVLLIGGAPMREGERIGPFVFERQIGSGGMAHVLLARDPSGRPIALKVLRRSRFETGLPRFRREFHALSRLSHPNVIRVDSYGDLRGHPYIAMEFVDGPDLHTVIRSFKTLPDQERFQRAESILIDLCRALAAIHRRGLVHRDLKPSNVLIDPNGNCKLTDFGIVKDLDPSRDPHLSTTLVGTWAYASPEHISGQPIDHRSDLYSLGVILFAMLTGKRPFVAENMAGYLQQHRDKPAPKASRIRAGVPQHLDEICARLLRKAPRDRFQSAQEVLYRLEAAEPEASDSAWEPPLLGNYDVLGKIDDAIAGLTANRGALIRVLGEDGSGRTRMLHAAERTANSLGVSHHFLTFRQDAPVYSVTLRFARTLVDQLPADATEDLRSLLQAIAEGTSLQGDTRYALYDALKDTMAVALRDGSIVLLLDDCHAASNRELHLFRYLARNLLNTQDGFPLLIAETSRPSGTDDNAELASIPHTTTRLEPLSVDDIVNMVADLVGEGNAAQLLGQRLHRETEGNPFFASEFLRSLVAQDIIRATEHGWQLTIDPTELAEGHLEIPPGIRQMLRRRLEGHSPLEKLLLESLSASREPIDFDMLVELVDDDDEEVQSALDHLASSGLVEITDTIDGPVYRIIHQKLAELVHQGLSPERRRYLHLQLATLYEEGTLQDPETMEIVGEHYRQANKAGKAYRWLVGAAKRLVDGSLTDEAWSLTERVSQLEMPAQALLPQGQWNSLRADHLYVRAAALTTRAQWDEAATALQELIELAEDMDKPQVVCEAQLDLSAVARRRGQVDRSNELAQLTLRASRRMHFRRGVAESLGCLAANAWMEGDVEQCEALANEGLLVTQGPHLATQRARLLFNLATAQATRGQLASAIRGLQEATDLFQTLRLKQPRVLALSNLAELYIWQGQLNLALERAEEAVRAAEVLGYQVGLAVALRARGSVHLNLSNYPQAQDDLHHTVTLSQRIGIVEEDIGARSALAHLCIDRQDTLGVLHHGAQALESIRQRDTESYLPEVQAMLAEALANSRPNVAATLLKAAEMTIRTLQTPRQIQVQRAIASAYLANGMLEKAREHATQVVKAKTSRSWPLLSLEARIILCESTTGEMAKRHLRSAKESAGDYLAGLPVATRKLVERRPTFKRLSQLSEEQRA